MELRILLTGLLLAVLSSRAGAAKTSTPGTDSAYVIVTDAGEGGGGDSYAAAVQELAKLRTTAAILNLNNLRWEDIFRELRKVRPRHVAFVLHPETIEGNFVGAVFQGLTELDDDPYLDCAYGYITGATAEDALKLVRNTAAAQARTQSIPKRFVAVAHTFAQNDLAPFAAQQADYFRQLGYETAGINPIDDSAEWEGKADRDVQKLNGASLVYLAGHGMGDKSCAIAGEAFGRLKLESALVLNGTCHSAVTGIRYDSIDASWTIKATRIDAAQSVCLSFIKAGAIGQIGSTASSSWQNVAFCASGFLHQGQSVGEALQESLNDKIRGAGIKAVRILPFEEGHPSPQALGVNENPGGIQSIARVILVGDPAYRPFPRTVADYTPAPLPPAEGRWSPEQGRIRQLVNELSDPKAPRFKALNDVIAIGKPAVPLLIREMRTSGNWQIAKALGRIGDEQAIAPLIEKLGQCRQPPMPEVIAEALKHLTGNDFGVDAEAWNAWWQEKNKQGSGSRP